MFNKTFATTASAVSAGRFLSDTSGAERRREERHACNWPAVVRLQDGRRIDVVAFDTSRGGMGLVGKLSSKRGERVRIDLPGIGSFECEIAWNDTTRFGVSFRELGIDYPGSAKTPAGKRSRVLRKWRRFRNSARYDVAVS